MTTACQKMSMSFITASVWRGFEAERVDYNLAVVSLPFMWPRN
jgi:hypothetical protein